MKRIVIKFGGTSVGTIEKIINAAKIVKRRHKEGNEIMVVVSAMSGTTNDLINRSQKISDNFNKSELDVLMSSGEQISSALLAGALIQQGIKARSWMGWQIPIFKTKIHLINKLKNKRKNIYVYCKSKYTAATISILKKNKFSVKAAIDDSYVFKRGKFSNYKTINSNIFLKQAKNKLSKIGVIISHQKIGVSNKINDFLIKNGFKKNQIVIIKY